jgi:hypothetical protein
VAYGPTIQVTATNQPMVLLRGASVRRADTLEELATLGGDGNWRTPEGAITDAIGLPQQTPRALITPKHARALHEASDAAWQAQALRVLREIAVRQEEITVDDLWRAIPEKPRQPRQVTSVVLAARAQGLIERTSRHRPSTRSARHGRPVRVWRSLVFTPPALCEEGAP